MNRGLLTIGRSLAVSAKKFPDKIAIFEEERRISYGNLNARVNQLARGLQELGLSKGEHVALLFGNSIEHMVALYAVAKLGAVSVGMDIQWKAQEMERALAFFDCDLLLLEAAYRDSIPLETALELKRGCFIYGALDPRPFGIYEELVKGQSPDEPEERVEDDDLFMIMLTSGTTGIPKGCMIDHKTYALHCINNGVGRGLDETSRELGVVPIYYNSGRGSLIAHLYFGAAVYLRRRFDPLETMQLVERERITSLALAPTMCYRILQLPHLRSFRTDSIRSLRKAGSPIPRQMVEDLIRRITPNIYQSYATTDTGQMTLLRPEEQLAKLGSSGRPIWGVELEIVDENRGPVGPGKVGDIRVRSPLVCQGYYKNPVLQASCFDRGWFYTGDLGRLDGEGYLYVVGRKKEIIKTGSINVAPKEIEEVLLSQGEIADAAVVGMPDAEWGEAVKAFVVLKQGCQISEEKLLAYCKERLAGYKVPKIVEFIPRLPRSPLGKITVDFRSGAKSSGEEE